MSKPTVYAANPDGPMIYRLGSRVITEAEAWRRINAGRAKFDDSGVVDWYAMSNGLGRYADDMDARVESDACGTDQG